MLSSSRRGVSLLLAAEQCGGGSGSIWACSVFNYYLKIVYFGMVSLWSMTPSEFQIALTFPSV